MKILHNKYGWILVLLILLYSLFLRTYDLSLDPPMNIGTLSQDLATDPYTITSFAVNKVKFGQWEFFEYPKWQVFKVSLSSLIAYILYSIGKVDIFWTHLAGVIPAFLGIVFFLWGIRREFPNSGWLPILIAAILLGCNFVLITYGRAPFLETGAVFYYGLIFILLKRGNIPPVNAILIGIIAALSILSGRIFSISIILALFAALLFSTNKHKFKIFGFLCGSLIISGLILLFILYGNRIGAYQQYLTELSETSQGNLIVLKGIDGFITMIFSFGTENRLYSDSPLLFIAGYVAITLSLLIYRNYHQWFKDNFTIRFSLWWILWMFIFYFPSNYRPIRYSLLIYFPLALTIASLVNLKTLPKKKELCKYPLLVDIVLFLVSVYFSGHFIIDFFLYPDYPLKPLMIYVIMGLPALILIYLLRLNSSRSIIFSHVKKVGSLFLILASISLVYQTYAYFLWLAHSHKTTVQSTLDFKDIVNSGAVLTGPQAPHFTMYSDAKHFIYYFGLSRPEISIFESFPISHAIVDRRNLEKAYQDFPLIKQAILLNDYLIRDRTLLLLYIPNPKSGYKFSAFEKAEHFLQAKVYDSALVYNRLFLEKHPMNFSGLKQTCRINGAQGYGYKNTSILNRLYNHYKENIDIMYYCAINYKQLGLHLKNRELIRMSQQCLKRVKWMSQGAEDKVQKSYDRIRKPTP